MTITFNIILERESDKDISCTVLTRLIDIGNILHYYYDNSIPTLQIREPCRVQRGEEVAIESPHMIILLCWLGGSPECGLSHYINAEPYFYVGVFIEVRGLDI